MNLERQVHRQARIFGGDAPWEQVMEALEHLPEPVGPEVLLEIVRDVGLEPLALVLDVGAYGGRHAIALASEFGCRAIALDLVLAGLVDAAASISSAGVETLISRLQGDAHILPLRSSVVDLIWARDMLSCVDPHLFLGECARVLKPRGHVVLHAVYTTDLMEPRECARLRAALALTDGCQRATVEEAITRHGFVISRRTDVGAQWREQELTSGTSRLSDDLLALMRLQRGMVDLVERFGQDWFETIVAWNQWAVYMALGKLEMVVYLLESRHQDGR